MTDAPIPDDPAVAYAEWVATRPDNLRAWLTENVPTLEVVMVPEVIVIPENVLKAHAEDIADQVSAMETKRLTTPALDDVMTRNGWSCRAVVLGATLAGFLASRSVHPAGPLVMDGATGPGADGDTITTYRATVDVRHPDKGHPPLYATVEETMARRLTGMALTSGGHQITSGGGMIVDVDVLATETIDQRPAEPVYKLTESQLAAVIEAAHVEASAGYGVPEVAAVMGLAVSMGSLDAPIEPSWPPAPSSWSSSTSASMRSTKGR